MILFVNNFKVMSDLIEKWAKKCGQPFSSMKWFNGCLTNIKVLFRLFVKIYRNARKAKRYYYYLYGLRKMSRLPNIVFLSSINQSLYVKSECLSLKIPTIALVDTTQKTFCYSIGIPANDQSLSSLLFFFMILNKSVIFGKYSCILSIGKAMKKKKWYNMFLNEDFLWWQERLLYIYLYKIKNNSNMRKKYLRLKKKETKLLKYNYGFKNDITIGKLK
jgi:ribosomal protein S2